MMSSHKQDQPKSFLCLDEHARPRQGVAQLGGHQVHGGNPVAQLDQDHEDNC